MKRGFFFNLLGGFSPYPSEKSWSEWKSVGMIIPFPINDGESHNPFIFQTTNQKFPVELDDIYIYPLVI